MLSPLSDYLDAVRAVAFEALDPAGPSAAAAEALAAARERAAAADEPPLILRLAEVLTLSASAAAVLEIVAAAVGAGLEVRSMGPLYRALGDRRGVSAAVRELRAVGLVGYRTRKSPTEPLSPVTMAPETARVLTSVAPDEDAVEACGIAALLDGPAFDAEAEGVGVGPFASDLDYFEAATVLVRLWGERHDASEGAQIMGRALPGTRRLDRRTRADVRAAEARRALGARVEATREAGADLPRLVALGDRLGLSAFERDVLLYLCCGRVQPGVRRHGGAPDVEDLVGFLTSSFREAVEARTSFYAGAVLLREGVVELEVHRGDLNTASVIVDPQTLDWVLGLGAEAGATQDGTHLFTPVVRIEDVHLPATEKARVLDAAGHDDAFRRARAEVGLDDRLAYGRGLVFLFHGPPGTGKTMLAHALAAQMGKRLLLVNEGAGMFERDDHKFRSLLRQARLADAVLFFDEAESFFGGPHVPRLLTEMERHDGVVVLATNRPEAIEPAMRRRCTVSVRFDEPDAALRQRIWEGLLPERAVAADVDAGLLAERFALPGGYVKNAVLTALAAAAARAERTGAAVRITQADLESAAAAQVRARAASDGLGAVVPRGGLDRLVFEPAVAEALAGLVALERERPGVLRAWGFGRGPSAGEAGGLYGRSTVVLLEGPPGTGKTAAAEALAFDLGRPLHVVTAADVMDKYVGETAKRLRAAFDEARGAGAVLVLDEADALLEARGGGSRWANADVSVLLGLTERHDGLVVLTTNRAEALDGALARRLWLRLTLGRPGLAERRRLWAGALPAACPRAGDVDAGRLAAAYSLSGAEVERAAYRAAATAALAGRIVCQSDLEAAAEAEGAVPERRVGFAVAA